jgi:hypothetical protein
MILTVRLPPRNVRRATLQRCAPEGFRESAICNVRDSQTAGHRPHTLTLNCGNVVVNPEP